MAVPLHEASNEVLEVLQNGVQRLKAGLKVDVDMFAREAQQEKEFWDWLKELEGVP